MCDAQSKLVAWLDGELPSDEAATTEARVRGCPSCRSRLAAYEKAGKDFNLYCDAVFEARRKPPALRWIPALAMASAAVVISLVVYFRARVAPPSPRFTPIVAVEPKPIPAPADVAGPAPQKAPRLKPTSPVRTRHAPQWESSETSVEIAIPTESIFAPGAMPEGMRLIGELRIGPDGSVRQVRFQQ